MMQNEMQQSKELEARKAHVDENSASSSMSRNLEVRNQVINLDSLHFSGPIQVVSIPLVQSNMAFMSTWQATLSNMASVGVFNIV